MVSLLQISVFLDYVIIGEEGWEGIRDDAPEEAKKAFSEFMEKEKKLLERCIRS